MTGQIYGMARFVKNRCDMIWYSPLWLFIFFLNIYHWRHGRKRVICSIYELYLICFISLFECCLLVFIVCCNLRILTDIVLKLDENINWYYNNEHTYVTEHDTAHNLKRTIMQNRDTLTHNTKHKRHSNNVLVNRSSVGIYTNKLFSVKPSPLGLVHWAMFQ